MKKVVFSLFALGLCSICVAQPPISILNSDMPNTNDTIRISTSNTDVNNLLNDTGANKVWDVSNLIPSFQDMVQCKSVINTNIAFLLSFSSSSFGIQEANLNNAALSGSEVYNFYSKNSTRFAIDGRGITYNNIPVPQAYTSKEILYKFPLIYGAQDSSEYVSNEANLVVATIKTSGSRKNIVDAWGSLTTPYGTFNCIRVKSLIRQVDSISVSGFPFPIATNRIEYKWLAKGQKIPVLQIVTTSSGLGGQGLTTVQYRDINRPAVFNGNARFTTNKTTFTVQNKDTCILTSNSRNNPKAFLWTITPSSYVFTGGTNANSAVVKLFFTDTGKYTITLRAIYDAGTDDTTRLELVRAVEVPKVNFSIVSPSVITTSSTVQLYDSSTSNPAVNNWVWTFNPNTVSFLDGTSPSSQNLKIRFMNPGAYSITLRASNGFGSSTLTKENIVAVVPTGLNNQLSTKNQYFVYPNPINDLLSVESSFSVAKLTLLNAIGQKCDVSFVVTNDIHTANCALLAKGLYFLKIELTNGETYTERICKY